MPSWMDRGEVMRARGLGQLVGEWKRQDAILPTRERYTGRLQGEAHQTSGRATVYKAADGTEYLRLTDFSTSNGPDVHVVLGRSGDDDLKQQIVKGQLDSIELGFLKGNQGDQNYSLPASANLQQYDAVIIYCERFHAVFGVAKLEQF